MTNKKIVKEPTPESSPSLYYGDNDSVINLLFLNKNFDPRAINTITNKHKQSFSPVYFQDISTVRSMKEKYRSMIPKMSWRGKFCDFIYYASGGFLIFFLSFLISMAELSVAALISKTIMNNIHNDLLSISLTLITWLITMPFVSISCYFIHSEIEDFALLPINMKYHIKFNKKDKKLLKNKTFLNTAHYDKQEKHLNIMKKINDVFNHIEDTDNSDSIDLYELKNLYNEYMRLLSFMLTNKDNISLKLYDNYDQQLEELSQNIIKESNNIITLINVKNNYMKKNKKELDNLNQEILDNDAMTIFPMK